MPGEATREAKVGAVENPVTKVQKQVLEGVCNSDTQVQMVREGKELRGVC